jgi:hypothetical protein
MPFSDLPIASPNERVCLEREEAAQVFHKTQTLGSKKIPVSGLSAFHGFRDFLSASIVYAHSTPPVLSEVHKTLK